MVLTEQEITFLAPVVRHPTIARDIRAIVITFFREQTLIDRPVLLVSKDVTSTVSSLDDTMRQPWDDESG